MDDNDLRLLYAIRERLSEFAEDEQIGFDQQREEDIAAGETEPFCACAEDDPEIGFIGGKCDYHIAQSQAAFLRSRLNDIFVREGVWNADGAWTPKGYELLGNFDALRYGVEEEE